MKKGERKINAKHPLCKREGCHIRLSMKTRKIDTGQYCVKHSIFICSICKKSFSPETSYQVQKGIALCSKTCRKEHQKRWDTADHARKRRTGETLEEVGDIYFGNVKHPLMPAVGYYGHLGVITYNKDRDKIQCHLCGRFYRSLNGSAHLKIHQITNDEYKEKFSIARTQVLVGEGTREKQLRAFLSRGDEWKMPIRDISNDEQRQTAGLGKKRRLSTRNKTGHCPAQLLQKIKKLADKLGHPPSINEFREEYKKGYLSTISQLFGSYSDAVRIAGLNPQSSRDVKYTNGELIAYMKNFYQKHHRPPSNTDFNREYLPPSVVYLKRFGTLNTARALAKIPLIIQIGGWRWKQIELTSELRNQLVSQYIRWKEENGKTTHNKLRTNGNK